MGILALVLGWLLILPSADGESAVIEFVKAHHAELAELLVNLKENHSTEYDRAIRDLGKTIDRLKPLKERDRDRYKLELKHWQSQSRIDLLSARLQMSPSDDLKSQLRTALGEQWELKYELLKLDRDRTAERLKKLDQQLGDYSKNQDATVEKRFQSLTAIRSKKNRSKPAEKQPARADRKSPEKNNSTDRPTPRPTSR